MSKAVRWIIRLVSLAILAGVWSLLPVVMPGPSRLLSLLHLVCLVIVVDFAVASLLATFMPSPEQRARINLSPKRTPESAELRQSALAYEQKKGSAHDR